jgi:nitrate reductase NapE component
MVVAAAPLVVRVNVSHRARSLLAASAGVLVVALFAVWAVRFTGGLGGPVPVLSLWAALGPSR